MDDDDDFRALVVGSALIATSVLGVLLGYLIAHGKYAFPPYGLLP